MSVVWTFWLFDFCCSCLIFKIYFCIEVKSGEKERHILYLLVHCPNGLNHLLSGGQSRAGQKLGTVSFLSSLPHGFRDPSLWAVLHHFTRLLTGSWLASGTSGIRTGIHMVCWHLIPRICIPCHHTSPTTSVLKDSLSKPIVSIFHVKCRQQNWVVTNMQSESVISSCML